MRFVWISKCNSNDLFLVYSRRTRYYNCEKKFGIFAESTVLNSVLSIAQENRYQHLDAPEADPAKYISNHPGIERLYKRCRVELSYPKTPLTYSRLTWRIQLRISSLRNEFQAHLRFTLLSSVMVRDLTPHAYCIQRQISTSRHSLITYDPTPGMPLYGVCPLCITFESVAASTQSDICQTLNF